VPFGGQGGFGHGRIDALEGQDEVGGIEEFEWGDGGGVALRLGAAKDPLQSIGAFASS
jgi:hypothetical protein